jgi:predicted nucleic-acid-binding protein
MSVLMGVEKVHAKIAENLINLSIINVYMINSNKIAECVVLLPFVNMVRKNHCAEIVGGLDSANIINEKTSAENVVDLYSAHMGDRNIDAEIAGDLRSAHMGDIINTNVVIAGVLRSAYTVARSMTAETVGG